MSWNYGRHRQPHLRRGSKDGEVVFIGDESQYTAATHSDTLGDTSSALNIASGNSSIKSREKPLFANIKPNDTFLYAKWRNKRQNREQTEPASSSSLNQRHPINHEEYQESIERLFLMLRPEAHIYIALLDQEYTGYSIAGESHTQNSSVDDHTNTSTSASKVSVQRQRGPQFYLYAALMFILVGWLLISLPLVFGGSIDFFL